MIETNRDAAEKELSRFGTGVENHFKQLNDVKTFLDNREFYDYDKPGTPVKISYEAFEKDSVSYAETFDNSAINKIVITLTSLCNEMSILIRDASDNLFIPLSLYEESARVSKSNTENGEHSFNQVLPVLSNISLFVNDCLELSLNIIMQMGALYVPKDQTSIIDVRQVHFHVVFEYLGKLLHCLIVFDTLIAQSPALREDYIYFRKVVKLSFGQGTWTDEKLANLDEHLREIEDKIFKGGTLKWFLSQSWKKSIGHNATNVKLRNEMEVVLSGWASQIEQGSLEVSEYESGQQIVSLVALSLLFWKCFDSSPKNIGKSILVLLKKVPCIILYPQFVWFGESFLLKKFPNFCRMIDKKSCENINSNRRNFLSENDQGLAVCVEELEVEVCRWSVMMDSTAKIYPNQLTKQDLQQRTGLILQGLKLASNLKWKVESILYLHSTYGIPLSRSGASLLCHLLKMIKSVEFCYTANVSMLVETLPHLDQLLSFQILSILRENKGRISTLKSLNVQQKADLLSTFAMAEMSVADCTTLHRKLLCRVSLSFTVNGKIFSDVDLTSLLILLKRFDLTTNLNDRIYDATNTYFLYWHRIILETYLNNYQKTKLKGMDLMCHAINDSMSLLRRPKTLPMREMLIDALRDSVQDTLDKEFLHRICKSVETELRVKTHEHLQIDGKIPLNNYIGEIIELPPFELLGRHIYLKDYVGDYLQRTCYSLTAVSPHDCATYEKIRTLAELNYGLKVISPQLPSQSLEQGVDVLEIMRNISVFVEHYQYNLNQQVFIERDSKNKHLNSVAVKHLANSIRTHGAGIVNTTVNYTYQFLRRKFHILSQFLFDDHIKSRLIKDKKFWTDVRETELFYPFERAEKFTKDIRKLGMSSAGVTYLDQFRKLIISIGNAIAYIRLVRSGCLRCSSISAQYLPKETPPNMAMKIDTLIEKSSIQDSSSTQSEKSSATLLNKVHEAAQIFDVVIESFSNETLNEDLDFFRRMVNVFDGVVQDPMNKHLANFFIIIPPLSLNFVNHTLASRTKKKSHSNVFTDDGFAVGISYLLQVLRQSTDFESLYWWEGVSKRFDIENQKIFAANETKDMKLHQALGLSKIRLEEERRELRALQMTVISARGLFSASNKRE